MPLAYEPRLSVGTPRRLFESSEYMYAVEGRAWGVDPDGERFLMIRQPGTSGADGEAQRPQIDVVLNWFRELESRVPGG